jgi:hypothetical protein
LVEVVSDVRGLSPVLLESDIVRVIPLSTKDLMVSLPVVPVVKSKVAATTGDASWNKDAPEVTRATDARRMKEFIY